MNFKEMFDSDDVELFEKSCDMTEKERLQTADGIRMRYGNESDYHYTNKSDRQKWKNIHDKLHKELIDMDTAVGMQALSERLNKLAHRMGFTEEARKFFIETTKVKTVCLNISQALCGKLKPCRVVGSEAEGTCKLKSQSDMDVLVFIYNHVPSVLQLSQIPETNMPYFRMTEDNITPSGYVKLQLIQKGIDIIENVKYYESFYPHKLIVDKSAFFLSNEFTDKEAKIHKSLESEKHGPATTSSCSNITSAYYYVPVDHVPACIFKELPSVVMPWFKRKRRYGWPSKETMKLFKQMGCVVVPIGHQNSLQQKLQWRLSFINQEMYLMHNLNTTQYKCYVILKHYRTSFIKATLDDSLCSYHLKTALFYTIETSNPNIWQPQYLAYVVLKCLHKLKEWVDKLNCPNYFIPQENMFETKLNQEKKERLINMFTFLFEMRLRNLRLLSYTYEYEVPCKRKLIQVCSYQIQHALRVLNFEFAECMEKTGYPENVRIINKIIQCLSIFTEDTTTTFSSRLSGYTAFPEVLIVVLFMRCAGTYDLESGLKQYMNEMPTVSDIYPILNSSSGILRSAFGHFKRSLHSKLVSYTLMNSHQRTEKERDKLFDFVNHHVQKAGQANATNTRLQQASCLYINRQHRLVDVILEKSIKEESSMSKLLGACFHFRGLTKNTVRSDVDSIRKKQFQEVLQTLEVHQLTVEYLTSITRTCLTFDSMETIMVPGPLQYETLKTFGTSIHLIELTFFRDLKLVVIDPSVYLFYLWYKNKEMMNDKPGMSYALCRWENIVLDNLRDAKLRHFDAALNCLGHIYVTKGWHRLAIRCFRKSLEEVSSYNSAKWHIILLLFG